MLEKLILEDIVQAIAGDIMIDNDHRLYGLFEKLVHKVFHRKVAENPDIYFGVLVREIKSELDMPREQNPYAPAHIPLEKEKLDALEKKWVGFQ